MKKFVGGICALALCFLTTACKEENKKSSETTETKTEITSEATTKTLTEETTEETDGYGDPNQLAYEVEECVEIEYIETKLGVICIPQIDENIINTEDAKIANELYVKIKETVLEQVDSFLGEEFEETEEMENTVLVDTQCCIYGNILSISVRFSDLFDVALQNCTIINLDLFTGHAIQGEEVLLNLGYSMDQVEKAMRYYINRDIIYSLTYEGLYMAAAEETLPQNVSSRLNEYSGRIDESINNFRLKNTSYENPWDKLLTQPAIGINEWGYPMVWCGVPSDAGAEYIYNLVLVGRDDGETSVINPFLSYGEVFINPMTDYAVCSAAEMLVAQGYPDIEGYIAEISGITLIEDEYNTMPAYMVDIYNQNYEYIISTFAVDPYYGFAWEKINGEWVQKEICYDFPIDNITEDGTSRGAFACIYNYPSDIELWNSYFVDDFDFVEYGTGESYEDLGGETVVLIASDDILVSYEEGYMDGEHFSTKQQYRNVHLYSGQRIVLHLLRPEGIPTQAIRVTSDHGTGTYIITEEGIDCVPDIEYIYDDAAVG